MSRRAGTLSTRMQKCSCDAHEPPFRAWTSRQQIMRGAPFCGICNKRMHVDIPEPIPLDGRKINSPMFGVKSSIPRKEKAPVICREPVMNPCSNLHVVQAPKDSLPVEKSSEKGVL
jgi:hypothetical protein